MRPLAIGGALFLVMSLGASCAKDEKTTVVRPEIGCTECVTLISPAEGEVLDNGCRATGGVPRDSIVWSFDWEDLPGATKYELYVKAESAQYPVIWRQDITVSQFLNVNRGSDTGILTGWSWRVRPFLNGAWGEWVWRSFDVESLDTDCPGGTSD